MECVLGCQCSGCDHGGGFPGFRAWNVESRGEGVGGSMEVGCRVGVGSRVWVGCRMRVGGFRVGQRRCLTAAERRGKNLTGFEDLQMKLRSRSWS